MEHTIRKAIVRTDEPPHPMIVAIREVCRQIDAVERQFSMQTDPDLIEGCIYELEALRARYRYLLRTAREQGISCAERSYLWERQAGEER